MPRPKKNKVEIEEIKPVKEENPYEVISPYDIENIKAYQRSYLNPCYDEAKQPIKHPNRILIIGSSGSGKTQTLFNIIKNMGETFQNIKIFLKCRDEPIYDLMSEKIGEDQLQIYEGLEILQQVNLNEFFPDGQNLCVFDDLCLESKQLQEPIEQLFIRGRKLKDGITCIYLSQSYYKIPRPIRLQSNIIILKKVGSKRDVVSILNDHSLGLKNEELYKIYKHCVSDDTKNFLYIDVSKKDVEFRKKFDEILNVENFR